MRFPDYIYNVGKELLEGNESEGICAFAVVMQSGNSYSYLEKPCHAHLNDCVKGSEYIVDRIYNHRCSSNKVAKAYLRYVLLESPYAKAFAEDNIDNAWKRGYYVYSTEVDSNLLASALIAARMIHETSRIAEVFYMLRKNGASGHMAFFGAHMVNNHNGKLAISEMQDEGHVAIVPSWFTEQGVVNFYNSYIYNDYGTYANTGGYSGLNTMWEKGMGWAIINESIHYYVDNAWEKASKQINNNEEIPIAIFDHEFNKEGEFDSLPEDIGIPILSNILNTYEKEHILC